MQSSNDLETTTPSTATPMTEAQKQEAIRDFLFKDFGQKYNDVVTALNNAPVNSDLQAMARVHFVTAFCLAKEAFTGMSFASPSATTDTPSNVVELPRKKRKYTMKKKNGKRKST